jgi:hypothetical protein
MRNIANISRIFDAEKCSLGKAADSYHYVKEARPVANFVLCRDKDGNPTAVYSNDIWDYNPYRLSGNTMNLFRFDLLLEGEFEVERRALVDEAKYLLFCIQYFAEGGYAGTIAVSTLCGYYGVIRAGIIYCLSLSNNQFIGIITLRELFSNKNYLNNFLKTKNGVSFKKRTRAICKHLCYIGHEKIGFNAIADLAITVEDSKQTPVVPQRLYLSFISHITNDLESLEGKLERLPDFLSEFSDPFYGRSNDWQKNNKVGGEANWRPEMAQAIADYGLEEVFTGDFSVSSAMTLSSALKAIQYRMRLVLHLYTGMRYQEVMRMPFQCLDDEIISEEHKDEDGNTIVKSRVIKLISTTTKFTGYRKSAAWYAAPEAEKAVKILQLISEGLAKIHGVDIKDCSLFLNSAVVTNPTNKTSITDFGAARLRKPSWMETLVISDKDFDELQLSDPTRDFNQDETFQAGRVWPLASHQFRRSLAFYAASSGFVKLPTLKRQFKHLTLAMTRYYSRNFENAQSIFGCYNSETKTFEIPSEHIMSDCRAGEATNIVDMLMNDVLGSTEKLYGKTGGYVERQRSRLHDDEVLIEDVRAETSKRVDSGDIYYRDTLLGGCMFSGKCDSFMLGQITPCLTCSDATIKQQKVDIQIKELTEQLTYFCENDGEYQVLAAELDALVQFKQQRMTREQEEALV